MMMDDTISRAAVLEVSDECPEWARDVLEGNADAD